MMEERFKVGDHVTWNSEAGHASGTIIKVHTKDFDYKGHNHHASEDDPQYEIKSAKTNHIAAHKLVDNNATRLLVQMLPLSIEMRDHPRQEKTGNLPSPLPAVERQVDFSTGTLGLWSSNHFVIYYRDGRVPQPGIIFLGRVTGDVSIFDRPGPVTVRIERTR